MCWGTLARKKSIKAIKNKTEIRKRFLIDHIQNHHRIIPKNGCNNNLDEYSFRDSFLTL